MIESELGKIVAISRAYLGLSQTEFSRMCGFHRTTILSIENTPLRTRKKTADKVISALQDKGITFLVANNKLIFVFSNRREDGLRQH